MKLTKTVLQMKLWIIEVYIYYKLLKMSNTHRNSYSITSGLYCLYSPITIWKTNPKLNNIEPLLFHDVFMLSLRILTWTNHSYIIFSFYRAYVNAPYICQNVWNYLNSMSVYPTEWKYHNDNKCTYIQYVSTSTTGNVC